LQFLYEPLTLDVFPWTRSSFHIRLGVVFNEMELDGSASGSITLNHDTYTGSVGLRIQQQIADPYLGIRGNLFYFDHAHHWAMTGELGVMYSGDPRVSLNGQSSPASPTFASDLATVRGKIQHDANWIQFWPVASLGVSYSF
jgi:hypothetical protein